MTLPGIGESSADAVNACREEKGSFTSIEGIKDAAGIGDGILYRIKDLKTVNRGVLWEKKCWLSMMNV